jgi:hypothetical protein
VAPVVSKYGKGGAVMAQLPDAMDLQVRLFVAAVGAALAVIGWYRYFL